MRSASYFIWTWTDPNFSIAYDCRIFAIRDGEAILRTNAGSTALKKGAVVFINAAQPYRFSRADVNKPFKLLCINLDVTQRHSDITHFIQPNHPKDFDVSRVIERAELDELAEPIIIAEECGLLERILDVYEEYQIDSDCRDTRISALVTDIIISLVRLSRGSSSRKSKLAAAIKVYIHEHYNERITNESIAAELGYHPYYLSRIFREEVGVSMHKYLLDYRLREAQSLLGVSSESIEQIALDCGFSSSAHFAAAYKAKYGYSPSNVRGN
ncbi:MAG: helix-turn-helix transcriptional regulator [Clostridiales bacterium]|nr:helix-turn-helix transcriptional regulator [Clostridiales bacterium]